MPAWSWPGDVYLVMDQAHGVEVADQLLRNLLEVIRRDCTAKVQILHSPGETRRRSGSEPRSQSACKRRSTDERIAHPVRGRTVAIGLSVIGCSHRADSLAAGRDESRAGASVRRSLPRIRIARRERWEMSVREGDSQ